MKRLLGGLTVAALLGLLPFATGQDAPKGAPPAAAPQPGAPFFLKFDLNKDGKVDWEEYQKVKSGFSTFDADGDGFITQADFGKLMERNMQHMQEEMQRRMMERMQGGRDGDDRGMRGGPGRRGPPPWAAGGPDGGQDGRCPCCGGERPGMGQGGPGSGRPEGRQGWRGQGREQGRGQGRGQGPQGMGPGRGRPPQGEGMGWGSGEGDEPPPEEQGPPPPPR